MYYGKSKTVHSRLNKIRKRNIVWIHLFVFILIGLIFALHKTDQFAVVSAPGGPGGPGATTTHCDTLGSAGPPNNSYSQYDASGTIISGTTQYCAYYQYCSDGTNGPSCIDTGCSCGLGPNQADPSQTHYFCWFGGSSQGGGYHTFPTPVCRQSDKCSLPPSTNTQGYPCFSAGVLPTYLTPPPNGGTGGGSPVTSDPCSGTMCGDGTYCGGECGAQGQPGTMYTCQNQKMVGNPNNCGCQYCAIGGDTCSNNGASVNSCWSNGCQNQGGTCFDKSNQPSASNAYQLTQAVCMTSQQVILPNQVCWVTGNNAIYGKACSNGATSGSKAGICRPTLPGCAAYGEDPIQDNSSSCGGSNSGYQCCTPGAGYGYNKQTACVSPASSGMCQKTQDCSEFPGTTKVDANTNASSCVGSSLTAADFQAAQNGGTPISCCVPSGASQVAGKVAYFCSPYDKTEYDDSAGNKAGTCPAGTFCNPLAIVNPGDPPCDTKSSGATKPPYLTVVTTPAALDFVTCTASGASCSISATLSSNTPTAKTFNLSVSSQAVVLGTTSVTMSPGQSQTVPLTFPTGICPSGGVSISIQNADENHTVIINCTPNSNGDTVTQCGPSSSGRCSTACNNSEIVYTPDTACKVNTNNKLCCLSSIAASGFTCNNPSSLNASGTVNNSGDNTFTPAVNNNNACATWEACINTSSDLHAKGYGACVPLSCTGGQNNTQGFCIAANATCPSFSSPFQYNNQCGVLNGGPFNTCCSGSIAIKTIGPICNKPSTVKSDGSINYSGDNTFSQPYNGQSACNAWSACVNSISYSNNQAIITGSCLPRTCTDPTNNKPGYCEGSNNICKNGAVGTDDFPECGDPNQCCPF